MNPYTVRDIEKFIDNLWCGDHSWDSALNWMRSHPIPVPFAYRMELVEEHPGNGCGDSWFIFKVTGYSPRERFFKRTTYCNSFGTSSDGETHEVVAIPVERTDWEVL